jgi:hypothetical protein
MSPYGLVRGYEQIKIASVDRYRTQLRAALAALRTGDAHRASPTPG